MIRKQFYLTPEQNRTLERLARLRGVSQAEFVRDALDRYLLMHSSDTTLRYTDTFHFDRHTLHNEREARLIQREK